MNGPHFNIAAVERDTGLSKDVLRIWERRYGFPVPERDLHGERAYSADQVERLRQIKRLMDQGHRPGKLIAIPPDELATLAPRRQSGTGGATDMGGELDELLGHIRRHDATGYQTAMRQRLARQGLLSFVLDTVAPLTGRVGDAWEAGEIQVFEEHLFTELTKRLLRQIMGDLPSGEHPRVLLTSLPDEQHVLGLLMVEALLALEGAQCIPLGTQMPLLEIVRAAEVHRADIVALSFSAAFPQRHIAPCVQQLRQLLPAPVALWAGGTGVRRQSLLPGVFFLPTLAGAMAALVDWRARQC